MGESVGLNQVVASGIAALGESSHFLDQGFVNSGQMFIVVLQASRMSDVERGDDSTPSLVLARRLGRPKARISAADVTGTAHLPVGAAAAVLGVSRSVLHRARARR